MFHIGIDPGLGGGLAAIGEGGTVRAFKMPVTDRDVLDLLSQFLGGGGTRAVLERVSASPQMGVVSAFTFGRGFGGLTMALTAARIPFDLVTPRTWQTALACLSGGDKNITKRRAQQLFPHLAVTHAIADALLLAEYGRRLDRDVRRSVKSALVSTDGEANTTRKEDHTEEGRPTAAAPVDTIEARLAGHAENRDARGDGRLGHRGTGRRGAHLRRGA